MSGSKLVGPLISGSLFGADQVLVEGHALVVVPVDLLAEIGVFIPGVAALDDLAVHFPTTPAEYLGADVEVVLPAGPVPRLSLLLHLFDTHTVLLYCGR